MNEILFFLAGTGAFLFGLYGLSSNVLSFGEKYLHSKLDSMLKSGIVCIAISGVATALIQSSTASNTLAVKLTDKKFIDIKVAFNIIMGANIGTTATAYLAIISGINFSAFITAAIFVAVIVAMVTKSKRIKQIMFSICYLSLVFIGLYLVNNSMQYIREPAEKLIGSCGNGIVIFLISMGITALLSSSSLTSVLLVSLAGVSVIDIHAALIMVMGINIGTCWTVLLASIGTGGAGKAAAWFNMIFNIGGIILHLFLIKTGLLNWFIFANIPLNIKIALYHTIFNVTAVLLFYFINPELAALIERIINKKTAFRKKAAKS